jgi:hypothetical protein
VVTTQSQHNLPVAANVLNQEFTATMPNRKWVTDITYIPTREGWLYLAAVLDLFSRKVVGWAMDTQMTAALPLQALRMALCSPPCAAAGRSPDCCIIPTGAASMPATSIKPCSRARPFSRA